jgi:hypothetical protein
MNMKQKSRFTAVAALCCLGMLAAGCSHTNNFNPNPEVGTLERHKLSGKVLAFDMTGVPEEINERAAGHKFRITGIRAQNGNMVKRFFAKEKIVDDPAKADYVLKLKLGLSIKTAAFGTKCVAQSQWDILNNGGVVSTGTAEASASFPTVHTAGANCEIASMKAVSQGLDTALNKL